MKDEKLQATHDEFWEQMHEKQRLTILLNRVNESIARLSEEMALIPRVKKPSAKNLKELQQGYSAIAPG